MTDGKMAGYSPVIGNRVRLDLYANIRKVKLLPGIRHRISGSHMQVWKAGNVDMVVVRENTEGLYVGAGGNLKKDTPDEVAIQTSVNTRKGVERCLRYAFELCRKRAKTNTLTLCAKTNVLTNAMLLSRKRLEKLLSVANDNLVLQVSLDGGIPEHHDAYRGQGTWTKTVEGIKTLQAHGFHVRLSTTETPANSARLDKICEFHQALGIPEEDHFTRPLAKRGFSQEGRTVDKTNLVPEVTVGLDGVYWHPISTDRDMRVSEDIFPLKAAVGCIQEQLEAIANNGGEIPSTVT